MKKTLTVNLGGLIFNLEEDAFNKLEGYINLLKKHFEVEEGGDEIVSDIEIRIAEIFTEELNDRSEAVLLKDVELVIASMGMPEEFESEDEEDDELYILGEENEMDTPSTQHSIQEEKVVQKRKLLRDPDDRVIGGVAAGLAAYFDISVTGMRIIFLLIFGFLGFGIIPYLICWLVIPKAKNTTDKLLMQGKAVNVSSIAQRNREELLEQQKPKSGFDRIMDFTRLSFSAIGSLLVVFVKFLFIIFAASGLIALAGLLMTLILGLINGAPVVGKAIFQNGFSSFLFGALAILSIGIPILFLIAFIIRLLFNRFIGSKNLARFLAALWLPSIIFFLIMASNLASGFKEKDQAEELIQLPLNKSQTLSLKASDYTFENSLNNHELYQFKFEGYEVFYDADSFYVEGPKIDVEKSPDNNFYIKIKKSAYSKSKKEAYSKGNKISFNYNLNDTTLTVNDYFSFSKNETWSAQNLKATILIPVGGKIYIDKSASTVIHDVKNLNDSRDSDMTDLTWKMNAKGLACFGENCPDEISNFNQDQEGKNALLVFLITKKLL